MITKIWSKEDLNDAAAVIKAGELVSFPTETVYGLGADATNNEAVSQVYLAKGRPSDNPLIVHLAQQTEVAKYVTEIPAIAEKLMAHFWPGPLTLIFKANKAALAPLVTAGLDSVAIRIPDNQITRDFIRACGVPLVGPSANTSGKPSPTSATHVYHDLAGKIAGILDDGETGVGLESTVVDVTNPDKLVILRPGAISQEEIEQTLGIIMNMDQYLVNQEAQPKAPGMKYQHYSPNEPVILIKQAEDWQAAIDYYQAKGEKIGLLANQSIVSLYENQIVASYDLGQAGDIETAGRKLYGGLRYFSETPATLILAEAFSKKGFGEAVMNRLEKAAGFHYFKRG
ncbi:L-threonylcarbamoyladenylate synthase [Isobaculum melis]|uniref:Threonylcarbamoyl-AMP synthase n=1 Tax=Isobaculum melis TaxID=142588 RepID=A0A1H9SU32_9LACT|nr:L-threonylcarbamoyladenylate synthase [Isobaculum melis]SER88510.1 translation factor SUA5 [Isobaculum melis]